MINYTYTRFEPNEDKKEIFYQIEITCDTGVFSYAKWLTSVECTEYFATPTQETIDNIIETNYLQRAVDDFNNTPPADLWHDEACLIQIVQVNDECLRMLEDYPEIAVYRKQMGIDTHREYGNVYNYVNYILAEHKFLLESYNTNINCKTGYHLELQDDRWVVVEDGE